jgi:hypothetical protein
VSKLKLHDKHCTFPITLIRFAVLSMPLCIRLFVKPLICLMLLAPFLAILDSETVLRDHPHLLLAHVLSFRKAKVVQ